MKGTVAISEFMQYLQQNNLVIVPESMVAKDYAAMQKSLLSKHMVTLSEISKCHIWGAISNTRAYQLAKLHCREGELLTVKKLNKPTIKITRASVLRIAKMRGELQIQKI